VGNGYMLAPYTKIGFLGFLFIFLFCPVEDFV
jgi:hypothetical protein